MGCITYAKSSGSPTHCLKPHPPMLQWLYLHSSSIHPLLSTRPLSPTRPLSSTHPVAHFHPLIHSDSFTHSHPLVHSHSLIQSPTFIHSSILIRSTTLIHSSTQARRPVPVRVHGGVRAARLGGDGGRRVGGGGQHPRLRTAGARRAVQVRAEWCSCTLHQG